MADEDIAERRSASSQDLSNFPTLTDRLQQGMLNQLFLGPADDPPERLRARTPPSRTRSATRSSTRSDVFYDGNSQGGIFGGTRHGGRAGHHARRARRARHELLARCSRAASTSTPTPSSSTRPYPNELERPLLLALIQMLWDRAEPNGYAHHMTTDPLPEHAGARRCCCTWRSATTRWRTSRPRSRRGRSARRSTSRRSRPGGTPTSTRTSASRRSRASRSTARRWSSGTAARRRRRSTNIAADRPAPTRTSDRAQLAGGAAAEVGVPADRRRGDRRLQRRALPGAVAYRLCFRGSSAGST